MKRSWRRALVGFAAMTLIVLSAEPSVAATPNRMVNGDGRTSGKCMEIAGGGPSSRLVQVARCQSYAHQGWTLREHQMTFNVHGTNITYTVYSVESHDRDAAGRCLGYTGQNVQAEMVPCGFWDGYWLKRPASNGWFQLEAIEPWYFDYLDSGNQADRKCLDVHVDTTRTTDIVHNWTCGPSNKGNQLFRVQSA